MPKTAERIAIIGAGMAGLTCANQLISAGHEVILFEKSRGLGGRVCTRRSSDAHYDHGAQYFTCRDPAFQLEVDSWRQSGVIAAWEGKFALWTNGQFQPTLSHATRWVATPTMSALGRFLAKGLTVQLESRVSRLEYDGGEWSVHLTDETVVQGFTTCIITCPGPQASALIPKGHPLAPLARQLEYGPCWAGLFAFDDVVPSPFDAFHVDDHPLSWAARNNSKPGRPTGERWVVHASPAWSAANLELDTHQAGQALLRAFVGIIPCQPSKVSTHRWRYALSRVRRGHAAEFDAGTRLGLCGDALAQPKVEGAWLSGRAMAAAIVGHTLE